MLVHPLLLGAVPAARQLVPWLVGQLALSAKPHVEKFLSDPAGSVSRLGDVMVWNGPQGRHVLATLESLTEGQARVEQVVGRIETAQIGITHSLGTLTTLSMATLGVTSLAAGFMIWRMNALHRRLTAIGKQISDIQAHLHAQNQAHLQTGLDFLNKFERSQADKDLHTALEASTYATNVYRHLVESEITGLRRLVALNQCGRYYLLALTAQVRGLILSRELSVADQRLTSEKSILTGLAQTMFAEVLGKSPEVYLDANFQSDGVSLDVLTEIYQQAHQVGAVSGAEFQDAGELFEHFRQKIYDGRGWFDFRPVGKGKDTLVTKLKYLMACLEEVGRMQALHLRVNEAQAGKLSFQELEKAVVQVRERVTLAENQELDPPVVAFAFA